MVRAGNGAERCRCFVSEREPLRWKSCHSSQAASTASATASLISGARDSAGCPASFRALESYHAKDSLPTGHSPDSRLATNSDASCFAAAS